MDLYHLKMVKCRNWSNDFEALVDYVKQLKEPIQPIIDGRIQKQIKYTHNKLS